MAKKRAGNYLTKQKRRSSNFGSRSKRRPAPSIAQRQQSGFSLANFLNQNFLWTSLIFISVWYLIWMVIFGVAFFEWDWMNSAMFWTVGDNFGSGGQSALIYPLISLLLSTHAGVILFEIVVNLAIVATLWYAILTLRNSGLRTRWLWIIMTFYCVFPEFIYISGYTSKDQLIAVGVFVFLLKLYNVWRFEQYNWRDLSLLGAALAMCFALKVSNAVLLFACASLALVARKWWKHILIVSVCGLMLGIGVQSVFNLTNTVTTNSTATSNPEASDAYESAADDEINDTGDTGETSETTQTQQSTVGYPTTFNIGYMLQWAPAAIGNIFNDPNANISAELREYYDSTRSADWWTHYNPFNSEVMGRYSIPGAVAPAYDGDPFFDLCTANLLSCLGGWFKLESWLFMPKDLMRTIWLPEDSSVQPYFIVNFSPTSVPDFNVNTHICPSGLPSGFTKDDIKTCLIDYWGASEDRAAAFADSWEPLIRAGYATGKPFPGLTEAFVNLGLSGNILFDGFWLFWTVLVLLIIAIVRKKYHKLLPFLLVPVTIYASIILFAPLAYERYTFPIFFCVPFLIAIFIAEKSRRSKSA